MNSKQLGILNSLVTFAAENIPGGLSEEEREVAKMVADMVTDQKLAAENDRLNDLETSIKRPFPFIPAWLTETAEPLSEADLQRAVDITGVKLVYKPVIDLEVGDEFVMEGILYKVTIKDGSWVRGSSETDYLGFYNPNVLTAESTLHSWDTNVLTDDKERR